MAPSKMSAVLLVAGGLAFAGNAYVNPTAPRTAPKMMQYVSNTAEAFATSEGVPPQEAEQQSSWTGLFAGVTLGMLVGLAGGMNSASAMNYALPKPGERAHERVYASEIAKESRRGPSEGGSGSATGAGTIASNDFDKNVDKALERLLGKFDVEENFNTVKFQVDEAQVPKFEYAEVKSTGPGKNDPALLRGDSPVAAEKKAEPFFKMPELPSLPKFQAPGADQAPEAAQKKSFGFGVFQKKMI